MNVLAERLSRRLALVYGERFGLTIPEWRILAHLSQRDGVSVREVRMRVRMDKVKVTRAAHRLEQAGLVTKTQNADDRRLVCLALTDAGKRRMAELVPYVTDFHERLMGVLDDDERQAFLKALAKLERATEETVAVDPKGGDR